MLSSVKRTSSPGPDGVTYAALANLCEKGKLHLLDIYNKSWQEEKVPESWKISKVVPLLKPGKSPMQLDSFRPVSLTSCISKVMEKMINERILWWQDMKKLLPESIAGFRRGRCTMDCILDLVTDVENQRTEGNITVAVFLDVQRAYDTVSHVHVLEGLALQGFKGKILRWIADFLRHRQIFVVTQEGPTSEHVVNQGVPQGSVLSPTLFNAVMAQLPYNLPPNIRCSVYADDISIWTSGPSFLDVQQTLQEGLDYVDRFLRKRGMALSLAKTAILPFTLKRPGDFQIILQNQPIQMVKTHRFLGVILDRRLTWSPHVQSLEQKVNQAIRILRHLCGAKWGGTTESLLALHVAWIRPIVSYSLPLLHGLPASTERRLHLLLARSLRVCLGLPRSTSSALVYAEARQPPLAVLRAKETCRNLFRIFTQHESHPLSGALTQRTATRLQDSVSSFQAVVPGFKRWKPSKPPWTLPLLNVIYEIDGIRKKADMAPLVAAQMVLHHFHITHNDKTKIYTDGSCTEEASACAVLIPEIQEKRMYKLSHKSSSTTAELVAIFEAVKLICENSEPRKWVICTDSKPALQLIRNARSLYKNGEIAQCIAETVEYASAQGHNIVFQWIPSHIGIKGNEEADSLAKKALNEGRDCAIPVSGADIRHFITQGANHCSMEKWFDSPKSKESVLYEVDPHRKFFIATDLPRHLETLIHRLRLEVAYTNSFLHKIHRSNSPECHCGQAEENVRHILLECVKYANEREKLKKKLASLDRRPLTLKKLLGPWPEMHLQKKANIFLTDFLVETGLDKRL